MAAGNWLMFGAALEAVVRATLDFDSNAFRMVLVTSAYTPDQAAHDTWSDISANEVANGNGYTTHGKAVTISVSRTGLVVMGDCDDQTWTDSTITAKYAVLVRDADANGSLAGTDLVFAYCDLNTSGGSLSSTSGPFSVLIDPDDGVMKFTAAAS